MTFRGCETIIFGIRALFDLQFNWVVMQINVENIFNNVFQVVIFRKLQDAKGHLVNIVPFTMLFYGVHYFLYYQHGQHEEGVAIIEFSLSTK